MDLDSLLIVELKRWWLYQWIELGWSELLYMYSGMANSLADDQGYELVIHSDHVCHFLGTDGFSLCLLIGLHRHP